MKIDKEKFVCIGQEKLPDTIRYKRGNIFLIILGYVFAVIAGVNGVDGVHDILYNLLGYIYMGLINRIVSVIQILLIYGFYRMSFNYMRSKEYTWNEEGVGVYEHLKYDSFTRVNGLLMLEKTIFDTLGIKDGETTEDGLFTLKNVACLGCCSLSPVMMINDETYGSLTPQKVREILAQLKEDALKEAAE